MSTPTILPSTILPSTTCTVLREANHIRRVHPATATEDDGLHLVSLTELLHASEVPTARMLAYVSRPALPDKARRLITYWEDLGDSSPTCWVGAGKVLRQLHAIPIAAASGLALPHLESPTLHADLFAQLGLLTVEEDKLVSWLRREVALALTHIPPPRSTCIVHDDFWEKNILTTAAGLTYLIDWENAGLASPAWDLSFVGRALHAGFITETQARAFEESYGAALPDAELAHHYGTLHRARWVASLIDRTRRGDGMAEELLTDEAPLWADASPA